MLRALTLFLYLALAMPLVAQTTGIDARGNATTASNFELHGLVTNKDTGEPIPFCTVILQDLSGSILYGITTDFDGRYVMRIPPGQEIPLDAQLQISCVGYVKLLMVDLPMEQGKINTVDMQLHQSEPAGCTFICRDIPLIDPDPGNTGKTTVDRNQLMRMCYR